jgi:hypothetical protein
MAEILAFGRLAILYMALSGLIVDPKSLRQHSSRQIRLIAQSIKAFGFVVPILIDCRNKIIAGGARHQAAHLLGMDIVPVIRLEHLTEAQVKAFRIADNRLSRPAFYTSLGAVRTSTLSRLTCDTALSDTRMNSATRSPIIIVGIFVFALTTVGMTEASATRSPSTP